MNVRPARPEDIGAIVGLIALLAEFEKLPGPSPELAERLASDAFERKRLELWVAELDGAVVAYAATVATYSTFLGRPTLFLEDVFVHPDHRRRGVARAVMAHLERTARERGCGRFEWMVLDWNRDARALYDSIGARCHDAWRLYRVELGG